MTILIELFGGLAILLGAFVSLISLPMAALLFVAFFTVHLPYGFSSIKLMAVSPAGAQFGPVGYECNLLYLACLLALVLGFWTAGSRWPPQKVEEGRAFSDQSRNPFSVSFVGDHGAELYSIAAIQQLAHNTL